MLFSELIELFLEDDCGVSFVMPLMVTTERKNTATQEAILVATVREKKKKKKLAICRQHQSWIKPFPTERANHPPNFTTIKHLVLIQHNHWNRESCSKVSIDEVNLRIAHVN
jgi:hypothetical protein